MSASAEPVAAADCVLCAKQRGEGPWVCPVVYADDLVVVTHRVTGSLGYVFLETTRHVAFVHQLSKTEASAVGRIRTRWRRRCRPSWTSSSSCSPRP